MDAARISAEIAEGGPVLFSDVAGGSRDIILQHLGTDPDSGWLAFEARRAGQDRRCFFEWRPGPGADSGAGAGAAGEDGGGDGDGRAVEGANKDGDGRFVSSCDPTMSSTPEALAWFTSRSRSQTATSGWTSTPPARRKDNPKRKPPST